jgi:site-specific DNA-methyltransferase (adenine-specific)
MTPYSASESVTLYRGDALAILAGLPTASVDAIITDPPYSSGGMVRGDRTQDSRDKYHADVRYNSEASFTGDNRDQRGYGYWLALWLSECLRVAKPEAVVLMFTDWRQLPTTTDAVQAGGWVWRGIVPWHKPNARPISGRFTASCEYVVWASNGPRSVDGWGFALPGFYQATSPREREHLTQKPLDIMRNLVKIAPKGGVVLDPFMGSGTTGVAAVLEGRSFVGVELDQHYFEVAERRVRTAQQGYKDDPSQMVLGVEEAS